MTLCPARESVGQAEPHVLFLVDERSLLGSSLRFVHPLSLRSNTHDNFLKVIFIVHCSISTLIMLSVLAWERREVEHEANLAFFYSIVSTYGRVDPFDSRFVGCCAQTLRPDMVVGVRTIRTDQREYATVNTKLDSLPRIMYRGRTVPFLGNAWRRFGTVEAAAWNLAMTGRLFLFFYRIVHGEKHRHMYVESANCAPDY